MIYYIFSENEDNERVWRTNNEHYFSRYWELSVCQVLCLFLPWLLILLLFIVRKIFFPSNLYSHQTRFFHVENHFGKKRRKKKKKKWKKWSVMTRWFALAVMSTFCSVRNFRDYSNSQSAGSATEFSFPEMIKMRSQRKCILISFLSSQVHSIQMIL